MVPIIQVFLYMNSHLIYHILERFIHIKVVLRRKIILTRQITNSVITYAKSWHPNEGILILQGKKEKNLVKITGLIIPPFSKHGPYYSGFPVYELPFDLSYIGTIHSHPSGSN